MKLNSIFGIFLCFFILSQSVNAQSSKKLSKEETQQKLDSFDYCKKELKIIKEDKGKLTQEKNRADSLLNICKKSASKKPLPLSEIEVRNIGAMKWASKNLDYDQIKSIIPDIILANDSLLWEKVFADKKPACCFHKDDSLKQYGVLLNIPALKTLATQLGKINTEWRLPYQTDFDSITKMLQNTKLPNPILLVLSNYNNTLPRWKKPGFDLFDMQIAPLSYRLNNEKVWYGGDAASFYCYDESNASLDNILLIAEINDTDKSRFIMKEKDLEEKRNNYGLYVRLIKK
jgi:uncharacterized protein (TIGR02145 family)